MGEGLSFSPAEQSTAARRSYNVNNFFAPIAGSQFQQGAEQTMQVVNEAGPDLEAVSRFIVALKGDLDKLGLEPTIKAELSADVDTVESQLASPKPKAGIIRESLSSLRKILESGGGAVAGTLLQLLLGIAP